eukprot:2620113-Amphidinium_carterae.1
MLCGGAWYKSCFCLTCFMPTCFSDSQGAREPKKSGSVETTVSPRKASGVETASPRKASNVETTASPRKAESAEVSCLLSWGR